MLIGVTMRVARKEYPGGAIELYNAISCDWPKFLNKALPDIPYIFLPNAGSATVPYARLLGVDALLLTGGEDLGAFPIRDETEEALFYWATKNGFPTFGVCRGAQVINTFLGGSLRRRDGHVAARHDIFLAGNGCPEKGIAEVNSFHKYCVDEEDLAPALRAFAVAADGGLEGFYSDDKNICGIMWHPERESEPDLFNLNLIRDFFGGSARV